jgi:hypothetical protein
MRAYLIDPDRRTIEAIDFAGGYEAILKVVGCNSFTTGSRPLNGSIMKGFDAVYVSDDILEDRDDPKDWFEVDADRDPPSSHPIPGRGSECSHRSATSTSRSTGRGRATCRTLTNEHGHQHRLWRRQTRGQLRHWKKKLAERYAIFERVYTNRNAWGPIGKDMIRGSGLTRRHALDKLTRLFGPGVTFEKAEIKKRNQGYALWSILKPRGAVFVDSPRELSESELGSLTQDCVCVNYICVGAHGDLTINGEGLWTARNSRPRLGPRRRAQRHAHA